MMTERTNRGKMRCDLRFKSNGCRTKFRTIFFFMSSFRCRREEAAVDLPRENGWPFWEPGLRGGGQCKLATCLSTWSDSRQATAWCLDHRECKSADCRRILTLMQTLSVASMATPPRRGSPVDLVLFGCLKCESYLLAIPGFRKEGMVFLGQVRGTNRRPGEPEPACGYRPRMPYSDLHR